MTSTARARPGSVSPVMRGRKVRPAPARTGRCIGAGWVTQGPRHATGPNAPPGGALRRHHVRSDPVSPGPDPGRCRGPSAVAQRAARQGSLDPTGGRRCPHRSRTVRDKDRLRGHEAQAEAVVRAAERPDPVCQDPGLSHAADRRGTGVSAVRATKASTRRAAPLRSPCSTTSRERRRSSRKRFFVGEKPFAGGGEDRPSGGGYHDARRGRGAVTPPTCDRPRPRRRSRPSRLPCRRSGFAGFSTDCVATAGRRPRSVVLRRSGSRCSGAVRWPRGGRRAGRPWPRAVRPRSAAASSSALFRDSSDR